MGALAPDLFGLQEVLAPDHRRRPDQARQIADGLGYAIAYGAAWDAGGIEFGNAVLSKFPIVRSEVFPAARSMPRTRAVSLFAEVDAPVRQDALLRHPPELEVPRRIRARSAGQDASPSTCTRSRPFTGFRPISSGTSTPSPNRTRSASCGASARWAARASTSPTLRPGRPWRQGATFCRRNPFASELREPDRRIDYIFVRGPDGRGRRRAARPPKCASMSPTKGSTRAITSAWSPPFAPRARIRALACASHGFHAALPAARRHCWRRASPRARRGPRRSSPIRNGLSARHITALRRQLPARQLSAAGQPAAGLVPAAHARPPRRRSAAPPPAPAPLRLPRPRACRRPRSERSTRTAA